MNQKQGNEKPLACRMARRRLPALITATGARGVPIRQELTAAERAATERHLQTCQSCTTDYRLLALSHAAMDAAATPEPITPGEDFFKAVRARIHRGDAPVARADESWAAVLMITARQLIPVMALLLLLIISATLLSSNASQRHIPAPHSTAQLPRLYDDPAPSADEALDSFMAIEEKKDGK